MTSIKVKCYCGKFLDDPTHKETHQDQFLTGKEMSRLEDQWPKVVKTKVRNSVEEPWRFLYGIRHGQVFQILGIFQP